MICSIVATPTASESITLKNYDSTAVDLSGWTLWDSNALGNGTGAKSLTGLSIAGGALLTVSSLPFQINDSGETITLKNASNSTIDEYSN